MPLCTLKVDFCIQVSGSRDIQANQWGARKRCTQLSLQEAWKMTKSCRICQHKHQRLHIVIDLIPRWVVPICSWQANSWLCGGYQWVFTRIGISSGFQLAFLLAGANSPFTIELRKKIRFQLGLFANVSPNQEPILLQMHCNVN